MKIVAVIPAYNEGGRIGEAVLDAARFVDAVVVVDDGSTVAISYPSLSEGSKAEVYLLTHVINRGQGAALQTGMDYAFDHLAAEVIVHFDADGQMRGEEIPLLVKPIVDGEVDVTLGSRFLGRAENIPFSRRLLLKAAIVFTYLTSGLWLSDTHNGFRALSSKAARSIRLRQDRMAHASEILDLIAKRRLRYQELPVSIRYTSEILVKGQRTSGALNIVYHFIKEKVVK